ncbi:MAG: hypothetical protein ABEJ93_05170 [Candidatus Nanohalobium sp.]
MKWSLVLLVSVAVMASGCTALEDQMSDKQKFKSQLGKMQSSTYHVTYDLEVNMGGMGGMISGMVEQPELYSTGENSKFVVGVSGMTTAVYDVFGDQPAVCSEGSVLGGLGQMQQQSSGTGINCNYASSKQYFSQDSMEKMLENISVTVEGVETVKDRKCTMYSLKGSAEDLNTSVPTQASSLSGSGEVNICLDEEKGYPAIISVKANQSSELRSSEEGLKEMIRVEAESYSSEVGDVEMEVPASIGLKAGCRPFQANISSFDYSGDVKLSVNGENRTVQVSSGGIETVSFSNETRESGVNNVAVYADGAVKSDTCYYYGGSSGLEDFNLTGLNQE